MALPAGQGDARRVCDGMKGVGDEICGGHAQRWTTCPALRASTQHSCITWNAMTAPSFFFIIPIYFFRFSFPFTSDWEEEMEQPVCQDAFGQVLARGAQEWWRGARVGRLAQRGSGAPPPTRLWPRKQMGTYRPPRGSRPPFPALHGLLCCSDSGGLWDVGQMALLSLSPNLALPWKATKSTKPISDSEEKTIVLSLRRFKSLPGFTRKNTRHPHWVVRAMC